MTVKSKPGAFCALLLIIVGMLATSALAIDENWQYTQEVLVPAGSQPAKLYLGTDILDDARVDGADLRMTEDGVEAPFKLFQGATQEELQTITAVRASSVRPDFRSVSYKADNIHDGGSSGADGTYYQADGSVDHDSTWLVVDLATKALTSKAVVTLTDANGRFNRVQVEGSDDLVSWTLLRDRSWNLGGAARTIHYAPSDFSHLRFTFWHSGALIIDELRIYGENSGYLLFSSDAQKSYRLYYGNPAASMPDYDLSQLYTDINTPTAYALGEEINPLYDADPDGDGIAASDNCPSRSNADQKDSDGDGVGDVCDNCPYTRNNNQADRDNDGRGDACDNCPRIYNPNQLDLNLNQIGYLCDDLDKDGVLNPDDNCLEGYNPGQEDTNRNLIGDVCEDDDSDGAPNYADNCPISNPDQRDADSDGLGDVCDNCPLQSNRAQTDSDGDGTGDACQDSDGDGTRDTVDNCRNLANPDQVDWDKDSFGDACDNCPDHSNVGQHDTDRDGIGDVCDDAESRLLENRWVIWTILIIGILVFGWIAYSLWQKPPE